MKLFRLTEVFILSALLMSCRSEWKNEIELVLDAKAVLGEGAIWDHQSERLLWVDIKKEILHIYNPKTGNDRELFTGQMIGTVVPYDSDRVVAALENGFYQIDTETGTKKLIVNPEADIEGNRFNDGKCDPSGRFWAGTMSMDGRPGRGSLYRLDTDGTAHKMIEGVSVSNGIVWTGDRTRMFYIDTPTSEVRSFDFNNETGEIGTGEPVIKVPREMGYPDGMAIDENGNLWIALWGGFAVGCWNPDSGELLVKIDVPAKNVTSCAFGDDDLETLYITTARENTDLETLEKYPASGGLFKISPGVKGIPSVNFKGNI